MTGSEGTKANQLFNYERFYKERVDERKSKGLYREFKKIHPRADQYPHAVELTGHAKDITVWCSNDYMGMSHHPKVKAAVSEALERYGTGTGGSRLMTGNSMYHEELESEMASLHKKQAALIFTSGFVANEVSISTLARALPGCHIFSAESNHASLIQGVRSSRVPKHIFRHNDAAHLEGLLQKVDISTPKIVVLETVMSMTGSVVRLKRFCEVAHRYGAITFVDEVHAVGVYGQEGGGIGERDNLMDQMDIISGTFGKAFGNVGGYIASSTNVIDMVRTFGSGFIYTISLPPTVLAGALAAVRVLRSAEGRKLRRMHQANVVYMFQKLLDAGIPVVFHSSHIIAVHVGDTDLCVAISADLLNKHRIFLHCLRYPTVAKGKELLRISLTPHHTRPMMDMLIKSLLEVWLSYGLEQEKGRLAMCEYCQRPLKLDALVDRHERYNGSHCEEYHLTFNSKL